MLQVIFFAILFGIAMVMIPESKSNPARIFFESVNEIILKIVDIIMLYSPIGVFALLAGVLVQVSEGDLNFAFQILSGLGIYSLTVIVGLAVMVFLVYPFLIRRFAKVEFIRFIKFRLFIRFNYPSKQKGKKMIILWSKTFTQAFFFEN